MSTTVEEAVKVLHGVDASRRAGWAAAYSAKDQVEQISRDFNVAASEREIMRKALSVLYGFIDVYAKQGCGASGYEALTGMIAGLDAVVDDDYVRRGRSAAHSCRRDDALARRSEQAVLARTSAKTWEKLTNRFYTLLARRYGFRNWRQMKSVLDHYLGGKALPDALVDDVSGISEQLFAMSLVPRDGLDEQGSPE